MPLDRSDVEHIAALARIAMNAEEVAPLREELSHILEQFEVLDDLDTTGVSPTGHAVQLQAVMRDDVADVSLDTEQVLSNAPRREGEYFRVKAVLEE